MLVQVPDQPLRGSAFENFDKQWLKSCKEEAREWEVWLAECQAKRWVAC